ncbi:MAG: DUF4019 domain-containing protein [Sphingomonadales bacterium]|nr:DUF4019 domain-containing protein [Sphingomonadales bacterium]
MANRYQALTEKEKETLRLLLGGYDAKSMARHLGLSVHTVNERLRDARRKMSTSSSREAARLLREAESGTPEFLGDKPLGAASPPAAMESLPDQPERSGHWRRVGWVTGGAIMSLALAFAAFTSLTGGAQTAVTPPPPSAAEAAAVDAGRQWLALLDAGDWNASYAATGSAFRSLNSAATWATVSAKVRTPLGAMLSRQVATVDFAPAPPQGYWIVKFQTRYANRASAIETLSLAWEDGRWKVTGVVLG